jgi:hypothetical protein
MGQFQQQGIPMTVLLTLARQSIFHSGLGEIYPLLLCCECDFEFLDQ